MGMNNCLIVMSFFADPFMFPGWKSISESRIRRKPKVI